MLEQVSWVNVKVVGFLPLLLLLLLLLAVLSALAPPGQRPHLVLQITLAALVTDGAVQRVVDLQQSPPNTHDGCGTTTTLHIQHRLVWRFNAMAVRASAASATLISPAALKCP